MCSAPPIPSVTVRTPVLLTVDESTGSLAAVRALASGGYAPVVATFDPGVYAARSRRAANVVVVPDAVLDPEAFVDAVIDACRRTGVAAVLPGTEATLRVLASRASDLPSSVTLGAPPHEVVERALDKTALRELATAAGLTVPTTLEVTVGEVDRALPSIRFPAIVKPPATVLRAAGGLRSISPVRVRDARELRSALAELSPGERRLVQPWIDGELYAVCGVSWQGDVVCAFHQRSPRIWPPSIGGSSYAIGVAPNDAVDEGVRSLMGALRWDGVFCVQFLREEAGFHLIDVNPRVYGSMALAVASGVNLPTIWADLLLGRQPIVGPPRVGVRFRAEEDDVRAVVHDLRTERRPRAIFGVIPRSRTVHPVWSWRDPAPLATTLGKLARRVVGR
jgi:predicted ATP-grasp superfamily ATP-dependent carboligase